MKRLAAVLLVAAAPVAADEARVVSASVERTGGNHTVSVTLSHADTGWQDYADAWAVELEDGTVLGTRILTHPHVEEQPFTRALTGLAIPEGTVRIFIRTRTTKTGWGQQIFPLDMPQG